MNPALQQINVSYVPVEDRLLLKVRSSDDSEYRLWLTRRYTGLLLRVLQEQTEQQGGPAAVASRPETRGLLKNGAFGQSWVEPESPRYPLGRDGVLGFRIQAGRREDGLLQLQLSPENGEGLSLTLDQSLLYLLSNLLEQGLSQTDWRLVEHAPGALLH